MERPDPNGCPHCGLSTCNLPAMREVPRALPLGSEERRAAWQVVSDARDACEKRPAVDWQAAYREARTPPAEVAGMVAEALALDAAATPGPWVNPMDCAVATATHAR